MILGYSLTCIYYYTLIVRNYNFNFNNSNASGPKNIAPNGIHITPFTSYLQFYHYYTLEYTLLTEIEK